MSLCLIQLFGGLHEMKCVVSDGKKMLVTTAILTLPAIAIVQNMSCLYYMLGTVLSILFEFIHLILPLLNTKR